MNNSLDPSKLRAAARYIDSWLELNFAHSHIPAMQVAIRHGDTLVYSRSFGHADLKTKTPLRNDHLFRVASHSKTITATAVMQLVERGKLHLDDEVSKHVKWFRSHRDERIARVTIRQLLNHTAGIIRDGVDSNFWELLRPFPNTDELKEYIAQSELTYSADERFKYSNLAYGYLGAVIRAVSGVSYHTFVTENILAPLELHSTFPDVDNKAKERFVTGYGVEYPDKGRPSFDHVSTRALSPATGFYSNAEDLCRYFAAHFIGNTSLISDQVKRQMQHGYWWTGGCEYYGIGLVHYSRNGWDVYGHSGGFPGFITNTQFDAKKNLVVSVLTSAIDAPAKKICGHLINIIDTFQRDDGSDENSKYSGRFYTIWGPTDFVATGKKIYAIDSLGWTEFDDAEELIVVSESTLRIKNASGYSAPGEAVTFHFNEDKSVEGVSYAGRKMLPHVRDAMKL